MSDWDGNGWHTPDVPVTGSTFDGERLSPSERPNVRLPLNGAQTLAHGIVVRTSDDLENIYKPSEGKCAYVADLGKYSVFSTVGDESKWRECPDV